MKTKDYKDLVVWQKSLELVKDVYKTTASFPTEERFGLISQMRRCAISIPSNIAEGSIRKTRKDFSNFVTIALGSATELETQLIIAKELAYLPENAFHSTTTQTIEVLKMLTKLRSYLSEN